MRVVLRKLVEGRLRWALILWVFVMSAIAFLDRVNISIAGQALAREYKLSNQQLGYVFSAFVLGYALFQAPGGRLADRFGPRRVIALGVVWWGLFTTLTTLVPTGFALALPMLIVVRFVLGNGEAVMYPSSNRLVANWIPSQERGIANGLIFAGVGAGAGITPPLIAYIMVHWGWRWSFYASALIGLAAGAVWYLIARDTPREHPWIGARELVHIAAGLPPAAEARNAREAPPWRRIVGNTNVLVVTLTYFTFGYASYIFFTWFFTYLNKVRGLDLTASAIYSTIPFLAMAICSPLGGWVADLLVGRYGRRVGRCGVAAFGMGLAAVFLALATQVKSAELASVALAGGAGALYLSQSAYWAVTADIAGPWAGFTSGLMNMGGQIGGAVTASLTPWIAAHFGWSASFLVAAALAAAGSAAWLLVDPDARI
jgi:ACS family glucarate transporter-like MFS transporter